MPQNPAFSFVPVDKRRSLNKPRKSGMSMIMDYQMGLRGLEDLLEACGDYIDIYKVCTGTSRLFDRDHLSKKNELLRKYNVRPFLGGQFQEYVMHHMGIDALPRHLDEAREVGFDIVEVSDNIIDLGEGNRKKMMDMVRDHGLSPVGEIGDKLDHTDPAVMVQEIKDVLAEGAEFAMIEGQELVLDGQPNEALINRIKDEVDISRCMFEVSTPRVGLTLAQVYQSKKFLVKTFGPDVNIGNIAIDTVVETETTRLGLGAAGPLSVQL